MAIVTLRRRNRRQAGRAAPWAGLLTGICGLAVLEPISGRSAEVDEAEEVLPGLRPPVRTAGNARTFNFTVPAPRGQIIDRRGQPLANNAVVDYLAVVLPREANVSDADVLARAERGVADAERLLGAGWKLADQAVLEHYRHRRWFPLRLSPVPLTDPQIAILREAGAIERDGSSSLLALEPAYLRRYPAGSGACQIVGYVGRKTPLETAEIHDEEILFENFEGRAGLEIEFEKDLRGGDGLVNFTFAESGELVGRSVLRPAEPGHSIVTTLDRSLQTLAESVLQQHARRGALVVVDAETGDILTLASFPLFDPNAFVPFIASADFARLQDDPDAPMFGRAHGAAYPPGSAFKPFVACALLERGTLTPQTMYNGPPYLEIDGRVFRNWNDESEGMIDVAGALARSCNTFFYQAAIDGGAQPIVDAARIAGFGRAIGLPLPGEAPGSLPSTTRPLGRQATANLAIGQGDVLVTPLQMALAMGALGNGRHVLGARLVSQIQDYTNNVIQHDRGRHRGYLDCSPATLHAVRLGMDQVVNGPRGTATKARRQNPRIAGKTGTAQWSAGDGRSRNLAWFAGFTFSTNPQLAFSAVYEGDPGEAVGGGAKAAPIMADFLEAIYADPAAFGFDPPVDSPAPDPSISPWVSNGSGDFPRGTLPSGAYAAHRPVNVRPPEGETTTVVPGTPVRAARPPVPFWKRLFGP